MFNPFSSLKARATQFVEGGTVHCPVRQRDVEFDQCFGCSRLVATRKVDGRVQVECNRSGPPTLPRAY